MTTETYNPLDKDNLADSVVRALLAQPCGPLPPDEPFEGAGIYVLYYRGSFKAYRPLSRANKGRRCTAPIYVGRARPKGARKGTATTGSHKELYQRLRKHATSIDASKNLELADFRCRFLVIDELWVPLAERLLLERYRPLWNSLIDGFGINAPGSGREDQKRSSWDVLHPGRGYVANLAQGKYTRARLIKEIDAYFCEQGKSD